MMTDTGGWKQSVDGAELAVEQLAKGGADHQHTHSTLVTVMLTTSTVITSIQYVQIILITVSSILITSITSITIILISITDDRISISVMLITQTCHSDHTDAVHLDHNV